MSVLRVAWSSLPRAARAAVQECTGPVIAAEDATAGMNSGIAAKLRAQRGDFFVKGMPVDQSRMTGHLREAAVNPFLPPSAPRLLWRAQAAGWDFLGFEFIDGEAADYGPGSPDLPLVVAALEELATTPCPDIPLLDCAARYDGYTDTPELFSGDTLLHTDINPENTLISNGTAHLVDWAWPTKGAAWVDPAVWLIRLITAGHSTEGAEAWAAKLPAWSAAPSASITVFAHASARMWTEIADQHPDSQWTKGMAESAVAWAGHRRRT